MHVYKLFCQINNLRLQIGILHLKITLLWPRINLFFFFSIFRAQTSIVCTQFIVLVCSNPTSNLCPQRTNLCAQIINLTKHFL